MWKTGYTWPGLEWEAKVFDVPSCHGINGGRVSKLFVRRDGQPVYWYDRGLVENKLNPGELELILGEVVG